MAVSSRRLELARRARRSQPLGPASQAATTRGAIPAAMITVCSRGAEFNAFPSTTDEPCRRHAGVRQTRTTGCPAKILGTDFYLRSANTASTSALLAARRAPLTACRSSGCRAWLVASRSLQSRHVAQLVLHHGQQVDCDPPLARRVHATRWPQQRSLNSSLSAGVPRRGTAVAGRVHVEEIVLPEAAPKQRAGQVV